MRQWFALIAVLFACLFVAQSTLASTSAYSECCLQGCKGMTHCASPSCQACEAPAAINLGNPMRVGSFGAPMVTGRDANCAANPIKEIWHPPD